MRSRLAVLLIILIFSCREINRENRSVLLLHYFTGSLSSGIEGLTDLVNLNQDDYNLIATPMEHEEFKVSLRIQLDSINPPDLFSYWAGARTKFLLESDKLSPITELFKNRVDISVFDNSVIEACSYNGDIYMLPITRHYVGFFYNIKIFKDIGIEPPGTWEELLLSANKLKLEGINPFALGAKNRWPAQFWFDYILIRSAGFKYREDLMNGRAKYSDPEVIKALELWKTLIDMNLFGESVIDSDWDEKALDVAKGDSAMTLMGTWVIPLLESKGLKPNIDYGFFPFPIIDSKYELTSLGPIDGILLSKKSKNRDISMDVLFQLARSETQEAFNSSSGAIAPHLLVDDDVYNPVQLEIKRLIKENKNWAFNYDLATKPLISEAGLNFFIEFLESPEDYKYLLTALETYHKKNLK